MEIVAGSHLQTRLPFSLTNFCFWIPVHIFFVATSGPEHTFAWHGIALGPTKRRTTAVDPTEPA